MPICDFCSDPDPRWKYPAKTFIVRAKGEPVADTGSGDLAAWAACDSCAALVEADDRAALAKRSLHRLIAAQPEMVTEWLVLLDYLTELHAGFFKNRTGSLSPIL